MLADWPCARAIARRKNRRAPHGYVRVVEAQSPAENMVASAPRAGEGAALGEGINRSRHWRERRWL